MDGQAENMMPLAPSTGWGRHKIGKQDIDTDYFPPLLNIFKTCWSTLVIFYWLNAAHNEHEWANRHNAQTPIITPM